MKSFKQIQEETILNDIEYLSTNEEISLEEAQSLAQKLMMMRKRSRTLKRILKQKKNIIARKKRLKARRPLSRADLSVRARKLAKKVVMRRKFGPKIADNWKNLNLGIRVRYNQKLQQKHSKLIDKVSKRFRIRIKKAHLKRMKQARQGQ